MSSESINVDREACRRPPLADGLRALLAEAALSLHAGEATLWVFADEGDTMTAALNHGPASAIVEMQAVPATESVVGFVATQGTPMVVGPGDWQNPTVMAATGIAVIAMVAVPVRCADEVIGTLSVINPVSSERFGIEELRSATAFAARAADILCTRP
jgi:hypothetical protein